MTYNLISVLKLKIKITILKLSWI